MLQSKFQQNFVNFLFRAGVKRQREIGEKKCFRKKSVENSLSIFNQELLFDTLCLSF